MSPAPPRGGPSHSAEIRCRYRSRPGCSGIQYSRGLLSPSAAVSPAILRRLAARPPCRRFRRELARSNSHPPDGSANRASSLDRTGAGPQSLEEGLRLFQQCGAAGANPRLFLRSGVVVDHLAEALTASIAICSRSGRVLLFLCRRSRRGEPEPLRVAHTARPTLTAVAVMSRSAKPPAVASPRRCLRANSGSLIRRRRRPGLTGSWFANRSRSCGQCRSPISYLRLPVLGQRLHHDPVEIATHEPASRAARSCRVAAIGAGCPSAESGAGRRWLDLADQTQISSKAAWRNVRAIGVLPVRARRESPQRIDVGPGVDVQWH